MWKQINTLELAEKDANAIVYADFDEFAVSEGVLHTNDKLYFLLSSKKPPFYTIPATTSHTGISRKDMYPFLMMDSM